MDKINTRLEKLSKSLETKKEDVFDVGDKVIFSIAPGLPADTKGKILKKDGKVFIVEDSKTKKIYKVSDKGMWAEQFKEELKVGDTVKHKYKGNIKYKIKKISSIGGIHLVDPDRQLVYVRPEEINDVLVKENFKE